MAAQEALKMIRLIHCTDCEWQACESCSFGKAKEALEKQIPKKPRIVYGEKTNTHNLGRLLSFHCPRCERFLLAIYETDVERGGGISQTCKGCSTCLQAIDFNEFYHRDKLDEEIELD